MKTAILLPDTVACCFHSSAGFIHLSEAMLVSESYQRTTQTGSSAQEHRILPFLPSSLYTLASNTRGQLSTMHLKLWHLAVIKYNETTEEIWPSSRPNLPCRKDLGRNSHVLGDLCCSSPSQIRFLVLLPSSLVLKISVCCLDWLQSQWMWQLLHRDLRLQRGQELCLSGLVT